MFIKRMNKKVIMLTVSSEELYKVSEAFSTHITVGKGDNITMKMSNQSRAHRTINKKLPFRTGREDS